MNLMDKQDKKNISSNNPDEPKDELGFEVALVGSGKKVLLLGERENDVSSFECGNSKFIKEYSDVEKDFLGSEKFDVIVLGDLLQCIDSPKKFLKKLKNFLNPDGYLVCSITNIAHAYNRIKLLNGEFAYTPNGLINENFVQFYTLDTILSLLDDANYSITKLYREKEDLDLIHNKEIKYFTIPDELIESIKNDPESLVSKYVFSIIPKSTNKLGTYNYQKEFSRSMTTERLRDLIRYNKEDLPSLLYRYFEKKLQEKDSQIKDLEKKISKKTD